MKYDFNADYGMGSGEYLKIKEGANKVRILSAFLPYEGQYQGKPNFKWVGWVLDRNDGVVKPYFMPNTIKKQIGALQRDEEWGFDSVPMPYDITIDAKNAGTKEVDYSVFGSPKRVELTAEELAALEKRGTIDDFLVKLMERDSKKEPAEPQQTGYEKAKAVASTLPGAAKAPSDSYEDIDVENVPF